jgi:peptide/nickel transport system substrate-binding protein
MLRVPVTVMTPPDRTPLSSVLVQTLRQLGFRAYLRVFASTPAYYAHVLDSRTQTQASVVDWLADYPAPSNFLGALLSCKSFVPGSASLNQDPAEFCNRRIDDQIARALREQEANLGSADAAWASVDRAVVDQAPLVPFENPLVVDFVSRRVGDYQYNPQSGVLLDQLWVR